MMQYAIIELNNIQYWIEDGLYLRISRIKKQIGTYFLINKILLLRSKNLLHIGQPYLSKLFIKIFCKICEHFYNTKIIIYKMKSKKKYRKKSGYRHNMTKIIIIF